MMMMLTTVVHLSKKTMDIKLPVPIADAKMMLSFSTLRNLHNRNYFVSGLL